ncbi:hypothetical protein [Streptomyces syringium]|uniref:hypothetical protein n=1 Tax=Streptomyces syringium TaxID=76729 RepID=UPI003448B49C
MKWESETMQVAYRIYYLMGEDSDLFQREKDATDRALASNSLAAAGPEHLTVITGTHTGAIRLTVEQRSDEPGPPTARWETAADVSLYSTSGRLWLSEWAGKLVDSAGNLAHAGSGWYRVRVQARGRDRGAAHRTVQSWVEEHLLSIWPAPPDPDKVHRITDTFGLHYYDPQRPPDSPVYPADALPWAIKRDNAGIRAWAEQMGYDVQGQDRIVAAIHAASLDRPSTGTRPQ